MRRRHFVIACAGLIAVACAYYLGSVRGPRPTGAAAATNTAAGNVRDENAAREAGATGFTRRTASLPPPGAPLQNVFAELQARANAGDVDAATRLYRDLSLCSRFRSIDWANSQLADELLGEQVDGMPPDQLENYRAQLEAIESRKRNVQRLHALCDGADEAMLATRVPAMQKAAQLGETHARACYLAAGPNLDARGLIRHPERLEAYRASVPRLIDAGIAAGDWKVVDLLRNAYQPGAEGLLAGVLDPDPVRYYRYLKLYRLGAEAYRTSKLDEQLQAAAARLAPEQVREADAWAETAYHRNFDAGNSTESTVTGWDPCSFPYE
ncbi:hypothetical protein M2650_14020 [Luteimonas sp. SX5]|uniref:Uncharacterized protein n=1 Tax=Luteimonas galliterrae TaxID=2940486 RepID=A0ABT0MLH5_9GAMM|nr:hypothetical protein [Luteimonas galliterrae]MCL1635742.1 hypothetical protein [Luteimonas galliterrae]